MANALSLDTVLVVSTNQVAADLSGEVIILGLNEGVYFSTAATAARIWELLQTPRRLSDIVDTLLQEYDVTAEQCTSEVLAFAEELCARGLAEHVVSAP